MTSTYIANTISAADLFLPRLLIDDAIPTATMTASSGTAEAVQTMTTYSRWTPTDTAAYIEATFTSPAVIDCVSLYTTDPDGAGFTLEVLDGTIWTTIGGTLSRTGAGCIMWVFDSVTADGIRVNVDTSPSVAVLKAGLSTVVPVGIPVGYEPSLFNPVEKLSNTMSVGGQILGTQIETRSIAESLSFDMLEPSWIESTWTPLRESVRTTGVFLAWNMSDHQSHVVYGAVVGDPSVSYSQVNTLRLSMNMEGPKHTLS